MNRTISITGQGYLQVSPDEARISFDVSDHQWKYNDALKGVNTEVSRLKSVCTMTDIDSDSLKSLSFNIRKDSSYDKKSEEYIFNGYIAKHRMELRLPLDNELIGKILEKLKSKLKTNRRVNF